MPCSRMARSFSIIGSSSIGDLLFEVLCAADVVVWRWEWLRRRRRERLAVERVLQDRLDTPVAAGSGEQSALTGGFHPCVGVCPRQPYDPQASAISHLRVRLVGEYAFHHLRRVRTDLLRPFDQP